MTDKETIESMLYKLATPKKVGSFFVNNATSDFLLIRPSGNPISAKGFEEMMSSDDVVQEKQEITKIHKFEFLSSDVTMHFFILGAKFSYEGTANDDLPTVISIFKKIDKIGKFIGCEDLQEIQICPYGISQLVLEIESQTKIKKSMSFNQLMLLKYHPSFFSLNSEDLFQC